MPSAWSTLEQRTTGDSASVHALQGALGWRLSASADARLRSRSDEQRWLPEFDYPDVETPESALDTTSIADEESTAIFAEVLPGQLGLLTSERELVGQIEAALANRHLSVLPHLQHSN